MLCPTVCVLQANGRFISDNRMRFLFGTSERGSLDSAMSALQDEVDAAGISEGLDRQQVRAWLRRCVCLGCVGQGGATQTGVMRCWLHGVGFEMTGVCAAALLRMGSLWCLQGKCRKQHVTMLRL
jgi:hypothetical protein